MKKSHIAFYIAFPIGFVLLTALVLFYMDLANGPLYLFILMLVNLVALAVTSFLLINKKKRIRLIPWGGFILVSALIMPFCKPIVEVKSAAYYANPVAVSHTLTLRNGVCQGIYNEDKDVEIYAGIPYAKPPVGELRWKEPQPVENWDGVLDCSRFAPMSMQPGSNAVMDSLVTLYAEKSWHPNYNCEPRQNMSEDSLYLNIWKPVDVVDAPILVFIHGGSLTNGSAASEDYNGEMMAKKGVIMITIAYRLGVFGYFAHPDLIEESPNGTTGNYGLLDQIAALKWVHDNAAYFGGDPDNITVAGESAGSSSVSAICTTPLLRGTDTFQKAIGESSSLALEHVPHSFRPLKDALKAGEKIMKEQGCQSLAELRKVPADKLVETSISNSAMTLDGYALDMMPSDVYAAGLNNESALLNGYNVKEADAFVAPTYLLSPTNKDNITSRLKENFGEETGAAILKAYAKRIEEDAFSAFNEIYSVYWFMFPHYRWSNLALDAGVDVFRYQFTKENGHYGTYHAGEMIYCYDNFSKSRHQYAYSASDWSLGKTMSSYWANFAKYGDPNGANLPSWDPYEKGVEKVMELGEKVAMKNEDYLALYPIFENYVPVSAES